MSLTRVVFEFSDGETVSVEPEPWDVVEAELNFGGQPWMLYWPMPSYPGEHKISLDLKLRAAKAMVSVAVCGEREINAEHSELMRTCKLRRQHPGDHDFGSWG